MLVLCEQLDDVADLAAVEEQLGESAPVRILFHQVAVMLRLDEFFRYDDKVGRKDVESGLLPPD